MITSPHPQGIRRNKPPLIQNETIACDGLPRSTGCCRKTRSTAANLAFIVGALALLFSLGGCGGRVITRDDSAVSTAEMQRAKLIQQDVVRVNEIARKLSIDAADLCLHKMPLLDFASFAMPTEGTSDEELQAAIRSSGLDTYARVIRSWNPEIQPGAKVEKVSFKAIEPSNFGSTVPWFLTVKAVDAESIDVVIDGVKHTYSNPKVCAMQVLYRVEKNPRAYRMASSSDRFMAILQAPRELTDFNRSDDEIAALLALELAANAGGGLDDAMSARNVGGLASLIPGPAGIVAAILSSWVSSGVATALTKQDEIDALAVRILKASGYNPSALGDYWNRCGKDCASSWPSERRDRWTKFASGEVSSAASVTTPSTVLQ